MRHPHDTHEFSNGQRLRLLQERVLVQLDPTADKSLSGLVLFPDGAMEHVMQTGTIKAFGYRWVGDRAIPIPDLAAGLKGVWLRFRQEQDSNKIVRHMFGDDMIVLKPEDILVIYDAEDHDRVLR